MDIQLEYHEKYLKYKEKYDVLYKKLLFLQDGGDKYYSLDRMLNLECSPHLKNEIITDLKTIQKWKFKRLKKYVKKLKKSIQKNDSVYKITSILRNMHDIESETDLSNFDKAILDNLIVNLYKCCKNDDGNLDKSCK